MTDYGEGIPGLPGNATNVLVTGPLMSTADERSCVELFAHPLSPSDAQSSSDSPSDDPTVNVVFVSFNRSPDECIELWQTHAGIQAQRIGVISIGDRGRFSDVTEVDMALPSSPVEIKSVRDPSDLPRIGLTLNAHLADFEDDSRPTVVCFHSVTALLQYVDQERAFRFLRILSAYLDTAGAVAHYHMDPSAHPDQVIATFRPLFDAVVDSGQIVAGSPEPRPPVADAPTVTDDQLDHGTIPRTDEPEAVRDGKSGGQSGDTGRPDGPSREPRESPDAPESDDDAAPPDPAPDDGDDESTSDEAVGGFVFVGDLSSEEAPVDTVAAGPDTVATVGEPTAEDGLGSGNWTEAFDTIMSGPTDVDHGEPSDTPAEAADPDRAVDTAQPTDSPPTAEDTPRRTPQLGHLAKTMLSLGLFATGIVFITLGIQASYGTSPLVEQFVAFVTHHPALVVSGAGLVIGGIGLGLILTNSIDRD